MTESVAWTQTHGSCRDARPLQWVAGIHPLGPMCATCTAWAVGRDFPTPPWNRQGYPYLQTAGVA